MDKKDEESSTSGNPYKSIEKATIIQEVNHLFLLNNKDIQKIFVFLGSNI